MTSADRRAALLLTVVGAVVVLLGARGTAEFSAHMAMDISQRMPLSSLFARVYMAEGMDTVTFRPGSVLAMRALGMVGSPLDAQVGLAKSLLVFPWLLAGYAWGRRRIGPGGGAVVALAPLLTPAGLFNAWHLGEWDLFGATLLLAADELLLRGRVRRVLVGPAALLYVAALLLKDSIAVATLLMLALASVRDLRDGRGWGTAPQLLLVGSVGALGVFFFHHTPWQQLLAHVAAVPVEFAARGGPLEQPPGGIATVLRPWTVTTAQLCALLGLTGAVTLVLGGTRRRLPGGAAAVVATVALLLPAPRWFQFYLCWVADSTSWVWLVGALVVGGLAMNAWTHWRAEDESDLAALVVLAMTAAWIVLPTLLSTRADISTRVFLPAVPLLVLILVSCVRRIGSWGRGGRAAALILGTALAWGVIGDGLRFGQRFLAMERVELRAKRELAQGLSGPAVLFVVNKTWQVTDTELAAMREGPLPPVLVTRVPFPVERPDRTGEVVLVDQGPMNATVGRPLARLLEDGRTVWAFSLLPRTQADERGRAALRSRFGGGAWDEGGTIWPVPYRTFDDDHFHEYSCCDPVEAFFDDEGGLPLVFEATTEVRLPPRRLEGLLWSLLAGAPLIERQVVTGGLYRRSDS